MAPFLLKPELSPMDSTRGAHPVRLCGHRLSARALRRRARCVRSSGELNIRLSIARPRTIRSESDRSTPDFADVWNVLLAAAGEDALQPLPRQPAGSRSPIPGRSHRHRATFVDSISAQFMLANDVRPANLDVTLVGSYREGKCAPRRVNRDGDPCRCGAEADQRVCELSTAFELPAGSAGRRRAASMRPPPTRIPRPLHQCRTHPSPISWPGDPLVPQHDGPRRSSGAIRRPGGPRQRRRCSTISTSTSSTTIGDLVARWTRPRVHAARRLRGPVHRRSQRRLRRREPDGRHRRQLPVMPVAPGSSWIRATGSDLNPDEGEPGRRRSSTTTPR